MAEVLFMVIFALLKGNTKFKEIFGWMIYNKENPILKKIFEKDKIEIPSDSTLHRILTNTDNNALEKVFRQYFSNYVNKENIAIDGKWLNGSDANGQYTNECHKAILNILDKDTKIVFAHKFMAKNKTNEISALKQALEEDDIFSDEGQIFSFDAIQTQTQILNHINNKKDKYIARVKNNQKGLKQKVIETIEIYKKPIIFPIHPRTKNRLKEFNLFERLKSNKNIEIIEPVGYLEFLMLEKNAELILTDSGGVQEEACILKVPCITLRDNTERPETVEVGANILVGSDKNKLIEAVEIMLKRDKNWINPYGDGKSGERIVKILIERMTN